MAKRQVCQRSQIGKGGQRTPMGLKLTSLMIFMHSISNPLPFSKGGVYKIDDLPSCKASAIFAVRSRLPF